MNRTRRSLRILAAFFAVILAGVVVVDAHAVWHAIHSTWWPQGGQWEAFFSGPGSDFGELAILGGVLGAWHKVNCHQGGCWRIGRHHVDGTPWCNHHHHAARAVVAAQQVSAAAERMVPSSRKLRRPGGET